MRSARQASLRQTFNSVGFAAKIVAPSVVINQRVRFALPVICRGIVIVTSYCCEFLAPFGFVEGNNFVSLISVGEPNIRQQELIKFSVLRMSVLAFGSMRDNQVASGEVRPRYSSIAFRVAK